MILPVFPDPITDGRLTQAVLAGDLRDRPLPFHHQFRRFLTKLGREFLVLLCQFQSSFPERTLFGPQSGKWEARQPRPRPNRHKARATTRNASQKSVAAPLTGVPNTDKSLDALHTFPFSDTVAHRPALRIVASCHCRQL